MDIAFWGLINEYVVVYLDDVTVFSKKLFDHISHLRNVFERCRKFGISLNPKKSIFVVNRGKLLVCLVSKDGIKINLEITQAIINLLPPNAKNAMQSFLGKINFVKWFIPNFSQIFKPLQDLMKKRSIYKWGDQEK